MLGLGRIVLLWLVPFLAVSQWLECDEVAQLQLRANDELQLHTNQTDPCLEQINTGSCQSVTLSSECVGCLGGSIIPSVDSQRFFLFRLFCQNTGTIQGEGACRLAADSNPAYTFRDPSDYLFCRGPKACKDFAVENVGVACCAFEEACQNSRIRLNDGSIAPKGNCTNDFCCNKGACFFSRLEGIRSLSCGEGSCEEVEGGLSQDLYCDETSCRSSAFAFATGTHCITCKSLSCFSSNFSFAPSAIINQLCSGSNSECAQAIWDVSEDSQMRLQCTAQQSCASSTINLESGSVLELLCEAPLACQGLVVNFPTQGTARCGCIDNQPEDLCPSNCQDDVTVQVLPRCGSNSACCVDTTKADGTNCLDGTVTSTAACGCSAGGGASGDPHIDTLDGHHYTLLEQGTFLFWRFSGVDAHVLAKGLEKKVPVDFKIYAHYSGHSSYTKGLLVTDRDRVAMEITSKDCQWRSKTDKEWKFVTRPQLLSSDSEGDDTAFNVVESGKKTHLELLVKHMDGSFQNVGTIFTRCRQGHFINTKISMAENDVPLVEGQLGPQSFLGMDSRMARMGKTARTDHEFLTQRTWPSLGGSAEAARYLNAVDEEGPSFSLRACSEEGMEEAKRHCADHLGGEPKKGDKDSRFALAFADCIFDVCHGGGEIAAELAEIFND